MNLSLILEQMIKIPEIRQLLENYIGYNLYLDRLNTAPNPTVSETFITTIRRAIHEIKYQIQRLTEQIFAAFENDWLEQIQWTLVRRNPQGELFFLNKLPFRN